MVSLFYPRICSGCDSHLTQSEQNLCIECLHRLPKTYYWDYDINPVEKLFWGRLPVSSACAFLHYQTGSMVQQLMHRFKYKGKKNIGLELGIRFGVILKEKKWFSDIDIIIPIPLHATKKARRGYNQSALIAEGLAEVFDVPSRNDVLKRVVASDTQTRKSRFDRSQNILNVFKVIKPEVIRGKKVLIVDDVVTTGSTLEEAGKALFEGDVSRLYIATLATA